MGGIGWNKGMGLREGEKRRRVMVRVCGRKRVYEKREEERGKGCDWVRKEGRKGMSE